MKKFLSGLLSRIKAIKPNSDSTSSDPPHRLPRLRDLRFHSIRTRGVVISTGMVLMAVVLAVGAFTFSLQAYYLSTMRTALEAKAETSASYFAGYVTKTYAEYYQSACSYVENFEEKDSLELQFVNADGRIDLSSTGISAGSAPDSEDIRIALSTGRIGSWAGKRLATDEKIMAVSAPLTGSDGRVLGIMRYVTSLKLVNRAVSRACLIASGVGIAVLAVVLVCNLYFLRTITEPIASLTAMAKRIAEGSYGTHVDKEYADEIGDLTDAINDMSVKLSQAERIQTEFISSVSHELRTPLTAITGWSETMAYDEAIQGDSRRGIEIITREAGRLTKMVEELLEFTRIQDGRFTLHISTVDMAALVEDCLYTYNELFRHEGLTVTYLPPDEDIPPIPGDPERLSQVVLNILDNACKYGKNGKKIDVDVSMNDVSVIVRIRDYGPGIPPADLPKIKTKFYKGASKERGSGIGLAVCEEIVTRHSGVLDIANASGGGVCVTITLPRKA